MTALAWHSTVARVARNIGWGTLAWALAATPIAQAGIELKDDRKDGKPHAWLKTPWTDKAAAEKVPLNDYPRPQLVRDRWMNLNGTWDYAGGAKLPDPVKAGQPFDFAGSPEQIKVPFVPESYLSGIMRKQELNCWYRRPFTVPANWAGQRVLIHFGGVISKASVFVNGKLVGRHEGSWNEFTFDLTDALRPGENELIVGAWDNQDGLRSAGKNCISQGDYSPSTGIYQTVWLEPVPALAVDRLMIKPDVKQSQLKVNTITSREDSHATVSVVAKDGDRVVAQATGSAGKELDLKIADVRLWSPEDPFLYDLVVELKDAEGKTIDTVKSYFGMRSIEIGKVAGQTRPLLNGKFVFQFGPLDQGYWPDGIYTAPSDAALKFDLEATKRLGFNMVRKHGKIEPQRWFYWCDKMGLLVWQDMPAIWYPEENAKATRAAFEREWQVLIDQHYNSPSVVAWVPFNENWGAFDVARITGWTKQYDPTRLVNGNTGYNNAPGYRPPPGDPKNGDFDDLHIYIGPGEPPKPSATRAACLGEFGGVGVHIKGHEWPVETNAYEIVDSPAAFTQRYVGLQKELAALVRDTGLGAAVYTQTTDVEHEVNGFLTYDRQVEKLDFEAARKANEDVIKAGAAINN